jgi:ATP adenylyltransferase
MDRLFSPWRAEHVKRVATEATPDLSVFSRMAAENDDAKNYILWRGTNVFVVLNLYPYTNGHLMVVPYRQVADYCDLNHDEIIESAIAVQTSIAWLRSIMNPNGFNIGVNLGQAAGAGIENHIHTHIVPRWSGDTNFTTTIGDFRVVPEELDLTYQKLLKAVASIPVVIPSLP